MALESVTHISDLVASNPVGATDPKSEGDDHIRNIKTALLTDFAGITGAVTATHTELNRLDANLGAFLSDSITDATGTVDVITATYSYAPALTDKTTLILRAAGANTSTTPTFNPNGLGAKTITKNGNQALLAKDIYGAGHVLILQYNSSNDVWELLNPAGKAVNKCAVYNSANQSIANITTTPLGFDTEIYDTNSFHDTVTNNSRITIGAGVTEVELGFTVEFAANATGIRHAFLTKNGFTIDPLCMQKANAASATGTIISATSGPYTVTSGDYFEVQVYQTSGGALNVTGGTGSTNFWMRVIA